MTTAISIIESALSKINAFGVGETLSADDAVDSLEVLNDMLEAWSLDDLLIYVPTQETRALVSGTASFTIGPTGDIVSTRPIKILDAYIRQGGTDYQVEIADRREYNRMTDKLGSYDIPDALYYEATMPNGKVWLLPECGVSCTLYFDVQRLLTSFATTGTDVALPPGYKRAIQYNLALELANDFQKPVPDSVARIAVTSKAQIRKINFSVPLLDSEPSYSRPDILSGT